MSHTTKVNAAAIAPRREPIQMQTQLRFSSFTVVMIVVILLPLLTMLVHEVTIICTGKQLLLSTTRYHMMIVECIRMAIGMMSYSYIIPLAPKFEWIIRGSSISAGLLVCIWSPMQCLVILIETPIKSRLPTSTKRFLAVFSPFITCIFELCTAFVLQSDSSGSLVAGFVLTSRILAGATNGIGFNHQLMLFEVLIASDLLMFQFGFNLSFSSGQAAGEWLTFFSQLASHEAPVQEAIANTTFLIAALSSFLALLHSVTVPLTLRPLRQQAKEDEKKLEEKRVQTPATLYDWSRQLLAIYSMIFMTLGPMCQATSDILVPEILEYAYRQNTQSVAVGTGAVSLAQCVYISFVFILLGFGGSVANTLVFYNNLILPPIGLILLFVAHDIAIFLFYLASFFINITVGYFLGLANGAAMAAADEQRWYNRDFQMAAQQILYGLAFLACGPLVSIVSKEVYGILMAIVIATLLGISLHIRYFYYQLFAQTTSPTPEPRPTAGQEGPRDSLRDVITSFPPPPHRSSAKESPSGTSVSAGDQAGGTSVSAGDQAGGTPRSAGDQAGGG